MQRIIEDMHKIGSSLEDISIGTEPIEHKLINVNGIQVKEKDLNVITPHTQMSSGMFRALSLCLTIPYLRIYPVVF